MKRRWTGFPAHVNPGYRCWEVTSRESGTPLEPKMNDNQNPSTAGVGSVKTSAGGGARPPANANARNRRKHPTRGKVGGQGIDESVERRTQIVANLEHQAQLAAQELHRQFGVDVPATMADTRACKLENCTIGCHYHNHSRKLAGAGLRLAIKDRKSGKPKPAKGKNARAYLCKEAHGGRCEDDHCHHDRFGLKSELTLLRLKGVEFNSPDEENLVIVPATASIHSCEEEKFEDIYELFGHEAKEEEESKSFRFRADAPEFVPLSERKSEADPCGQQEANNTPRRFGPAPLVIVVDDGDGEEAKAGAGPETAESPVNAESVVHGPLNIIEDYVQRCEEMKEEGPLATREALIYVPGRPGGAKWSVKNWLKAIAGFFLTPIATKDRKLVEDIKRVGIQLTDYAETYDTSSDALRFRWKTKGQETFFAKESAPTEIVHLAATYSLCKKAPIFSNLADSIMTHRRFMAGRALTMGGEVSSNLPGVIRTIGHEVDVGQKAYRANADIYSDTILYCINRMILQEMKLTHTRHVVSSLFRSGGHWNRIQLKGPPSGSNQ